MKNEMKLSEASEFLKSLITQTNEKSEIRIYEKFIAILSDLKSRGLTKKQLQSIEEELDTLKLKANPENRKNHLKRKLAEFIKYLKKEFSLISEPRGPQRWREPKPRSRSSRRTVPERDDRSRADSRGRRRGNDPRPRSAPRR